MLASSSQGAPSCRRFSSGWAGDLVLASPQPTWRNYYRGLMAEAAEDVPSSSSESAKPAMSKTKGRNGRGADPARKGRKREDSRQAKLFDLAPAPKSADLLDFARGRRFATV